MDTLQTFHSNNNILYPIPRPYIPSFHLPLFIILFSFQIFHHFSSWKSSRMQQQHFLLFIYYSFPIHISSFHISSYSLYYSHFQYIIILLHCVNWSSQECNKNISFYQSLISYTILFYSYFHTFHLICFKSNLI